MNCKQIKKRVGNLEKFFEEKALKLMKTINEKRFMKIMVVELQKCFQNMSHIEKRKFEDLLKKLLKEEDKSSETSSYFVDNFYKATVGRNVSIIGKKLIIEGKIKDVDDEKKVFEMVIKKSSNKKRVGSKIIIGADMFQDDLQFCAFE